MRTSPRGRSRPAAGGSRCRPAACSRRPRTSAASAAWSSTGARYGHGGAYATDMSIDAKRGLITVFLVQHAGFPGDGAKSLAAFRKAAEERFGKPAN